MFTGWECIPLVPDKKWIAIAAALAVCGAGAAVATGAIVGVPDLTSVSPKAQAAPAGLVSAFPSLGRAQTSDDVLPQFLAGFGDRGVGTHWGTNVSLSRGIVAPNGTRMWLMPGTTGTCITLANGQGACGPNSGPHGVETQGIWMLLAPTSGGDPTIEGVLPAMSTISVGPDVSTEHTVRMSVDHAFAITVPRGSHYTISEPGGATSADTIP